MSTPSTVLACFFSTLSSVNYILKNGKQCAFIDGAYYTSNEAEIAELNEEIRNGHPHIFVKPGQLTIESKLLDPMEALKAKFFEEFKANQAAALNPDADRGTTEQTQVVPANTNNIAEASAGGSGTSLQARLLGLKADGGATIVKE